MSTVSCVHCGTRSRVGASARGTPRCPSCKAPLPWIVDADDRDFDAQVDAPVPVLVDLWAPWCPPCRMVAPVLESLARKHARRLKLVKVNVDQAPATARRYEAMSIPTLVLLDGGREVERIVGALPEAQLETRIAPHLAPLAA